MYLGISTCFTCSVRVFKARVVTDVDDNDIKKKIELAELEEEEGSDEEDEDESEDEDDVSCPHRYRVDCKPLRTLRPDMKNRFHHFQCSLW